MPSTVLRLFAGLSALLFSAWLGAAPSADLWPRWQQHNPESTRSVDHQAWSDWLNAQVRVGDDGIHRIAYGKVSPAARKQLQGYLAALQAEAVSQLNRREQQAYWINLYNAATVEVVLAHYPVDSIRDIDISPGFFANGPWGKALLKVEGVALSLNDVEHRILRPIWQDPRIHYAVNCASLGCPNLAREAYTAERLDSQLNAAARAFINHPRGARVENGELTVSSIFAWFEEDFGDSEAAVIRHLRRYAGPELKRLLGARTSIDDDDYDWRLNDAR